MKNLRELSLRELEQSYYWAGSPEQKERIIRQVKKAIGSEIRKSISRERRNGVYVSVGKLDNSKLYFEIRVNLPISRMTYEKLLKYARRCPFEIAFPDLESK